MSEDETIVIRNVDLTSMQPIEAFGSLDPDVMFIATWPTLLGSFQFTFSRRNAFYQQASVWHYQGDAVYPAFTAQLIDDISQFDQRPVLSNSMPLWLAMVSNLYAPAVPIGLAQPQIQLYPAFLVPENLIPSYGVVSIAPEGVRPIASAPLFDGTFGRQQLCSDRVRVTLYGLRNDDAMDFIDYTMAYSQITGNFGLMNMPVLRDDRRTQVELAVLAMKKYIDFEVSYLQSRARAVARQVINSALLGGITTVPFHPVIVGP